MNKNETPHLNIVNYREECIERCWGGEREEEEEERAKFFKTFPNSIIFMSEFASSLVAFIASACVDEFI